MIRKPQWLSAEAWTELLRKYDGIPRCAVTGATDNLTVDHIIPRYLLKDEDVKTLHDVSNLQFLVDRLNCIKGIHPDAYWRKQFYLDREPDMQNARTAQRDAYNEIITRRSWFSQPISQISGLLYVHAWIVGAGKTIGMLTNACAVNSVIRNKWGAARRADRMLVLTKERAIRDQIAKDLSDDPVKYGVLPISPTVGVVEAGYQFNDLDWIERHDIAVACIHQLFEDRRSDLAMLLHRYPIINFDELQFAYKHVNAVVQNATTSLCFGFSGTPTQQDLAMLNRLVLVTVHGYQEADEGDRSLKYLSKAEPDQFIKELSTEEANMMVRGMLSTVNSSAQDGYEKNFVPPMSVALAVVAECQKRDGLCANLANEDSAQHRQGIEGGAEVSATYPAHPMIVCESIAFAQMLEKNLNRFFASNRAIYPENKGWRAEVVHTGGDNNDGSKRAYKPLLPAHPWMRAKNQGGRLDKLCARVLIVVNIGREGVNNPYCGPIGLACTRASLVDNVQRAFGRQLRSVVDQGRLLLGVPPAALDSALVITHEVYENRSALLKSIEFLMGMHDHFAKHPTIAVLEQGEDLKPFQSPPDAIEVPPKTKLDVVAIVGGGGEDVDGWPINGNPDDDNLIITQLGGTIDPDGKIDPLGSKIKDWIDQVRTKPEEARGALNLDEAVQHIPIVLNERMKREPTNNEMREFVRAHHADLMDFYEQTPRPVWLRLFKEHYDRIQLPSLVSGTQLEHIRRGLVRVIVDRLGHHYKGTQKRPHELIGAAVKMVLGVPSQESANKTSKWDIPECHAVLLRPEVKSSISAWVIGRLIDEGACPSLATLQRRISNAAE